MVGLLIRTIVFFLLREFFTDLGPWYLILMGDVCDCRYLDHAQRHCGIVGRGFRSRTFPASTSSSPPETKEQRFNSLCFGGCCGEGVLGVMATFSAYRTLVAERMAQTRRVHARSLDVV
jgi:hypothetical protein